MKKAALKMPEKFLKRWLFTINEGKFSMEDIDKDFDQFLKMFTWNYLQKHFIKQDNLSVTKEEALAEAKSLAAAQFAQYGMPSAPEDMLAGYAEKILADKDQGQKIYEKLYEAKVVEDVKSKIKVTEKAVSAEDFAKLAQALYRRDVCKVLLFVSAPFPVAAERTGYMEILPVQREVQRDFNYGMRCAEAP